MGFENFATNEPTPVEEEKMSEEEVNIHRMGALLVEHGGDVDEVKKTVLAWIDEAKKRFDGKKH